MRPVVALYTYIFPVLLFAAGLTRINAISAFYFVAFMVSVVWAPTIWLPKRGVTARVLATVLLVVSGLACIGQAIFQAIMATSPNYGQERLPPDSAIAKLVAFIDFTRIRTVGEGFRQVTPDVVIFVMSLLFTVVFNRHPKTFQLSDIELAHSTKPKLAIIHAHFTLLLMFVIAVAKPALPQFVYLIFCFLAIMMKALSGLPVTAFIRRLFPLIFAYTIVHMLALYGYQIIWVRTNIPDGIARALGFTFYETIQPTMGDVTLVVSWSAIVLLFATLSVQHTVQNIHTSNRVRGGAFAQDQGLGKPSDADSDKSKYELTLRRIIHRVGWVISSLALLFVAIFIPSAMGFVLLIAVCLASMVPQAFLEKYRIIPTIFVYFILSILAQYFYNIDFGLVETAQLTNIGLVHFGNLSWLYLGAQMAAAYLLALYWSYAEAGEPQSQVGLNEIKKPDLPEPPQPKFQPENYTADHIISKRSKFISRDKIGTLRGLRRTPTTQLRPAGPKPSIFARASTHIRDVWKSESAERGKTVLKALGLWLLQQSYLVSLVGLYIAGLLRVNLLNTGYVLIFIVFLTSSFLAKKAWFVLVLYTEIVILLVYAWHALSSWTLPVQNLQSGLVRDVIGLQTYDSTGDLFVQGLLLHLIIMLFSTIQFHVLKFSETQTKAVQETSSQLPEWMRAVGAWFSENWAYWGLFPVYVTLAVVTVVDRLILPNLLYMAWFFVCLIIHIRFRGSLAILRGIWIFIVLLSGAILIARYAYQFVGLAGIQPPPWPQNFLFTLQDLGFYKFQENTIFVELLGNTAVFLIAVVQMRAFFSNKARSKIEDKEDSAPSSISTYPLVIVFLDFVKRFAMLHMYKITFLMLCVVSLSPICGMHAIYMCIGLFSLATEHGTDYVGLILLIYTQLVAMAQLLYQFSGPQSLAPDILPWLGLSANPNRWSLVQPYIFLSISLVLQRFARRAKNDWLNNQKNGLLRPDPDHPGLSRPNDAPEKRPRLSLFAHPDDFFPERTFTAHNVITATKWYLSNFLEINSYQFFVLAYLILVFVRHDFIMAPFYLLVIGISLATRTMHWKRNTHALRALTIGLGTLVFIQYLFTLSTPPGPIQYPWNNWQIPSNIFPDPQKVKAWFALQLKDHYVLLADFIAIFILSRVMGVQGKEIRNSPYWTHIISSPIDFEDFQKPRTWTNSIRYYIFRFSVFWVLVLVFAAGTVQPDVLSLGYVIFSLWFIFRESALYRRRNSLWRWARIYNFLLLMARILWQIPLISASDSNIYASIFGLRKVDEAKDLLFDIAIFILLHAQKILFERNEFDYVVRYLLDEEEKGIRMAHDRFQDWKQQRELQLRKLAKEKKRRRQQLDVLKAARERQQKLWENFHKVGGPTASGLPSAARGMTITPGSTFPDLDPRMRTLATTEDLKRLQEAGALEIEEDTTAGTVHMRFTPEMTAQMRSGAINPTAAVAAALGASKSPRGGQTTQGQLPSAPAVPEPPTPAALLFDDDGGEITIVEAESPKQPPEAKTTPADSDSDSDTSSSGYEEEEEEEESGEQEDDEDEIIIDDGGEIHTNIKKRRKRRSRRCRCRTPRWLKTAADKLISFLDRFTYVNLNELPVGRPKKIFVGLYKIYQRYSHLLCYVAFLINAMVNANILAMFYPLSIFVYALLDVPRPHKRYWNLMFVYTSLVIIFKFVFQISVFCICFSNGVQTWSVTPMCSLPPATTTSPSVPSFFAPPPVDSDKCSAFLPTTTNKASFVMSYPPIIGITKFEGKFLFNVLPDLVVLISVFMHRYWLKKTGYWAFVKRYSFTDDDDDSEENQKEVFAEARHFQRIMIKHMKKREKWSQLEAAHRLTRLEKVKKKIARGKSDTAEKALYAKDLQDVREVFIANPIFGNPLADVENSKDTAMIVLHDARHNNHLTDSLYEETDVMFGMGPTDIATTHEVQTHQLPPLSGPPTPAQPTKIVIDSPAQPPHSTGPSSAGPAAATAASAPIPIAKDSDDSLVSRKSTRRLLILSPKSRREIDEQEEEKQLKKKKQKLLKSQLKAEQDRERKKAARRSQQIEAEHMINTAEQPIVSSSGELPEEAPAPKEKYKLFKAPKLFRRKKHKKVLNEEDDIGLPERSIKRSSGRASAAASQPTDNEQPLTDVVGGATPPTSAADSESDLILTAAAGGSPQIGGVVADAGEHPLRDPYELNTDVPEDEEEDEQNEFLRQVRQTGHSIYMFYRNVFSSDKINGRDLYVGIWFVELLCFFYILVMPREFLGGLSTNVAQYLSSGRSIPMQYVMTLFVQFMFIVIDRILYLYRALKAKVVFQYCLVIFYHFYLWWWLPNSNSGYFYDMPALIGFYFLKFIYLYLSALQISFGYPLFVQGQFLTDSKSPSLARMYVFIGYRAIPFVYELRTLLDWTITSTSLTFMEWLKLEDIYAQLFLVKCRVSTDRNWKRDIGDKASLFSKIFVGGLLFVLLVAVIWLPLFLLMQGSPGATGNLVTTAELRIGFTSYGTSMFVAVSRNIIDIGKLPVSNDRFTLFKKHHDWVSQDDQKIMQIIEFEPFSVNNWGISPPAREDLKTALSNGTDVFLDIQIHFNREKAVQNLQSLSYQNITRRLPPDASASLLALLDGRNNSATIFIPELMPRFYRLPIIPPIEPQPGTFNVTLSLHRKYTQLQHLSENLTKVDEYWQVEQEPESTPGEDWVKQGIEIATFSSEVPSLSFVESFASAGIIGLYVGIVAVVGRFLRLSITDLAYHIIYDDMPECDEIISYCEDIYLARVSDDLKLEEELYRELIELYRSPERLILRSLPKAPRFGGNPKNVINTNNTDKLKAE